jgi:2-hydroxy-palmitic acid dioxygenase Mpo1-like protein
MSASAARAVKVAGRSCERSSTPITLDGTTARGNLLAWQWSDYPAKHRHPANLVIHIVAVPLFMLGCVGALIGLLALAPAKFAWGIGLMIAAVVLEGLGHRLEPERPAPFDGVSDFLKRQEPQRTRRALACGARPQSGQLPGVDAGPSGMVSSRMNSGSSSRAMNGLSGSGAPVSTEKRRIRWVVRLPT